MALEKYEYPASGAVTASWLPSQNGTTPGFGEELNEGIRQLQSSGKKEYRYESGVRIKIHRRLYTMVINSEKTSYDSFRDTVAGLQLKFTDHNSVAHTVTFATFTRVFKLLDNDEWEFEVVMREEL